MLLACVLLFVAAGVGLLTLVIQLAAVIAHRRAVPVAPSAQLPGFSILKPLCGADDALFDNLASFARLDYPSYEVLLGVKDAHDTAYPFAVEAAQRWPATFRVVLQRGAPGFNPKVNQLITLERAAHHGLLVVSDSNTRVERDYLREQAALFEDPEVACVTQPVVGVGERSWGSRLDNLHLCSTIGAGMIAAKRVAGKDLVVGKSMTVRRDELTRLGGFTALKDYLAEDYVLGRAVTDILGRRVAVARSPVSNVSRDRETADFFARYCRWSVIHCTAVSPTTYLSQALLNPLPLAVLGLLLQPSDRALALAGGVLAAKVAIDLSATRLLRGHVGGLSAALAVPMKDVLLFGAWLQGGLRRTVLWRGNRLRVEKGSRLVGARPPESVLEPVAEPLPSSTRA